MNTMVYKGYVAQIDYDGRDNVLFGRAVGVGTIISFHGETISGLRREFKKAIERYLDDCRERGVRPEKPASGKILLRVPSDVHGAALVAAQVAGKSLNQWATDVLRNAAHL
jgi:predicted HicB family RNase H-like nuclease